jgi:hypothetical protein
MSLEDTFKFTIATCGLLLALGLGWAVRDPLPPRPPPVQPDPEIIWMPATPEPTEFTGWGYYYPTPTPTPTPVPKEEIYGEPWPQDDDEEFDADNASFFCHYPLSSVEEGKRRFSTKMIGMPRTIAMHLRQHELDYSLARNNQDCDEDGKDEDPW